MDSDYKSALSQASGLYKQGKYKEAWQLLQPYKDNPEVQKALQAIRKRATAEKEASIKSDSEQVSIHENASNPKVKSFAQIRPLTKLEYGLVGIITFFVLIFAGLGIWIFIQNNSGFTSNSELRETLVNEFQSNRFDLRYPSDWELTDVFGSISLASPEMSNLENPSALDTSPSAMGLLINFAPDTLEDGQSLTEFGEEFLNSSELVRVSSEAVETKFGIYDGVIFFVELETDSEAISAQLILLDINLDTVPAIIAISSEESRLHPLVAEIILSIDFHTDFIEDCRIDLWWDGEGGQLIVEFLDTAETAGSTARISLGSIVTDMQRIMRDFERVEYPDCMKSARDFVVDGMDDTVSALQDFLAQDDSLAARGLNDAEENFSAASEAFEELGFGGFDSRLMFPSRLWD